MWPFQLHDKCVDHKCQQGLSAQPNSSLVDRQLHKENSCAPHSAAGRVPHWYILSRKAYTYAGFLGNPERQGAPSASRQWSKHGESHEGCISASDRLCCTHLAACCA